MRSRTTNFLATTAIAIAALVSVEAGAATTVYEQAPQTSPISYFAQSSVVNDPGDPGFNWSQDSDTQAWDYFKPASTVSFNRIGWYGTNSSGDFAVDLFSATCFSCGATKVSGGGTFPTSSGHTTLLPNSGPFSQAEVHKTFVSTVYGFNHVAVDLYSYYIDLGSTLTLTPSANQAFALSVVNNNTSLYSPFGWALSNTVVNGHIQWSGFYNKYLSASGDLAFSLIDTNATPPVSPVPEPDSALMLGVGLLALVAVVRRRKTA